MLPLVSFLWRLFLFWLLHVVFHLGCVFAFPWRFGDQTCNSPSNNSCLRLEPRVTVLKGLLKIVGRSDLDWAGDSATRQSVTGYHCFVQNVTMCNQSLKQTAISLSLCEAEFCAASACAGELLGLAELFKELHYDVAVTHSTGSDLPKDRPESVSLRDSAGGVQREAKPSESRAFRSIEVITRLRVLNCLVRKGHSVIQRTRLRKMSQSTWTG